LITLLVKFDAASKIAVKEKLCKLKSRNWKKKQLIDHENMKNLCDNFTELLKYLGED